MKFKTGKQQRKINKIKSCFFGEKINKNDKPIGRLTKKKRMQSANGQYQKLEKGHHY